MTDYAVVVGINNYPAFSPRLEGPEKDAKAFYDWLISAGGAVPAENIGLVLSSAFAGQNAEGQPVVHTKPTADAVNAEFMKLVRAAFTNFARVPRVGRRLYIYMSGHGITPRSPRQIDSAALLMANAEPESLGLHVSGPAYAEWFRRAHAFEEILLFMDCCRNAYEDIDESPAPFGPLKGGDPTQVRMFYGLATQWDAPAFEQPVGNPPEQRGVFTYALLEALKHPSAADGRLFASQLAGSMRVIITGLRKGDVPQFPKLALGDTHYDIALVETRGTSLPTVTIDWDPQYVGRPIAIHDGFYQPLSPEVQIAAAQTRDAVQLRHGLYNVLVGPGEYRILKVRPGLRSDPQEAGNVTVE